MLCFDEFVMILMNSEKTVESAVLGNPDISMAESSEFHDYEAGQPFKPFTGESTVCLLLVLRGRFLLGGLERHFCSLLI